MDDFYMTNLFQPYWNTPLPTQWLKTEARIQSLKKISEETISK